MKTGTWVKVIYPIKATGEEILGTVLGKTQEVRQKVITVRLDSGAELDFDPSQLEEISNEF